MKLRFFIALLFFTFAVAAHGAGPVITLNSESVQIARDKIYLGDVAVIRAGGEEESAALKTVYLKRAALPGYRTFVTKELVRNQVLKINSAAEIRGVERVSVFTEKTVVERAGLVETAEKYIRDNMPWPEEDVEITFTGRGDDITALQGHVLLKVKEDNKISFKGNVVVPVEVYVDGRFYRMASVSAVIKVETTCYIADADIRVRQSPEGKYSPIRRDITFLPNDVIAGEAALRNRAARRNIMRGTVLLASMFEPVPLFRRGQEVVVAVRVGTAVVESRGSALSDGREGRACRVKLVTGKTVEGIVGPDGRVIIER